MSLAGLILAAGQSRRFGRDKRLARFDENCTLLQKSISLIVPHCSLIVVVLKAEDKKQLKALLGCWHEDSRLHIVYAKDADRGMGHSLASGAESFLQLAKKSGNDFSGLLVMLADMPYVAPDTIQRVVDLYVDDKITYPCLDVIPLSEGWGHPVIFGSDWFGSLLNLTGDRGGRSIILGNPNSRNEIVVGDENILRDIDLPSDLV